MPRLIYWSCKNLSFDDAAFYYLFMPQLIRWHSATYFSTKPRPFFSTIPSAFCLLTLHQIIFWPCRGLPFGIWWPFFWPGSDLFSLNPRFIFWPRRDLFYCPPRLISLPGRDLIFDYAAFCFSTLDHSNCCSQRIVFSTMPPFNFWHAASHFLTMPRNFFSTMTRLLFWQCNVLIFDRTATYFSTGPLFFNSFCNFFRICHDLFFNHAAICFSTKPRFFNHAAT